MKYMVSVLTYFDWDAVTQYKPFKSVVFQEVTKSSQNQKMLAMFQNVRGLSKVVNYCISINPVDVGGLKEHINVKYKNQKFNFKNNYFSQ